MSCFFQIRQLLILCLCLLSLASYAQQPARLNQSLFDLGELIFQTVGDEKTIPKGVVTAMVQDKQGFIWLGTQFGLVRYDGYRFVLYEEKLNSPTSLGGNFVRSLWAAKDGRIWVGTYSDGISIYDPKTDQFSHIQHSPDDEYSLSNNTIRALTGDHKGNIYVATDKGLNHVDTLSGKVTQINKVSGCDVPLQSQRMRSVLLTQQQTLWLGSKTGLCQITLPQDLTRLDGSLHGKTISAFNGQNAYRLFQAENQDIWVGTTDHGAAFINTDSNEIIHIKHIPDDASTLSHHWVNSIAQPNADEIWLGTSGGGINVVSAATGSVKRHINHDPLNSASINIDTIGTIMVDDSGIVWVGTWGAGLNRHNPNNGALRTFVKRLNDPHSLSHEDVRSFLELDNGQIWVGNAQTGIDIIDPKMGVVSGFRPDPNKVGALGTGFVRVMAQTADGSIWVGTSNDGLYRFDPVEQRFYHYGKKDGLPSIQIVALKETANDRLWIGTGEGVVMMDLNTRTLQSVTRLQNGEQLIGRSVISFAYTAQQQLWVGARNGLLVVSLDDNKVTEISEKAGTTESLSDNYISSLLVDSQGRLLLATRHGLDRLISFDGSRAVFESLDKLVNRPIGTAGNLLEDELGRIWNGYGWIDPKNKTWLGLDNEDDWDIGAMWTGSYTKLRDGTLLFGGTKGIFMVRPLLWQSWQYNPPVVLSELELNNKSTPVPEHLILPAETKSFSFELSALDFTHPSSNSYAYMLEGFDDAWISTDASRRRVTYTRFSPGNYLLRIKGTNRQGVWSDKQISLKVTQLPTWYETHWFKVVLLFAITFIVYVLYLWRVRGLQAQKIALDNLVQSRTANISMLGTIGQEITSTLQLESVLERVYKHVNELMNAQVFVVGIIDQTERKIVCKLAIENGQKLPSFEYSLDDKRRPAVWCVVHNKELVTNNLEELRSYIGQIEPPVSGGNTQSIIYLPLAIDNQVIGCITVQSFSENAFSVNDVQMLRTIANYTAIALANADSVTKLASTYQELKQTHEHLKQTQEQLIQQEKMAGLGRLVSGVAHEINTPLGISITASSHAAKQIEQCEQLLNDGKLTKPQLTSFIHTIKESVKLQESSLERAAQLVKNFKQVAVDQSVEEMGSINLSAYMSDVLTSLHPKWKHTNIDVQTHFPESVPVNTYPGAIAQILTNLIENAVKHGFSNGQKAGQINIALGVEDNIVQWHFSDNGDGMSEETLNKVFEPFYTTKRNAGGTGLGMHIVFNIVTQKLNGEITCKSELGKGSEFVIKLPLESVSPLR